MAWFKFIMFFVWAAGMTLACWAFEVGRMFARRMTKAAQKFEGPAMRQDFGPGGWPAVAVILPIKGVEDDTEQNVRALLAQEYPRARLLFTVESADDPVVGLLKRLASENKDGRSIEIIVAGIADARGQKIQNQLAAVERTTEADEILVFMDADARPKTYWLRELVRPLGDAAVGASTGFRFYVPVGDKGGGKPTLPSTMASIINAGVAALLGPAWRNIAWGGSMAIRRPDFFAFGVHEGWQRALSDDYVLSWCVKNKSKRRIEFVQACLVASEADFTWTTFWEFAARQYRITKVCAPWVWLAALTAAVLYLAGMVYTLIFFFLSLAGVVATDSVTGRIDFPLLVMCVATYLANVIRGWFLYQGGLAALPDHAERLRRVWFWYTWGYPVSLVINLVALVKSAGGRTIEWRGVRYVLKSRFETIVQRNAPRIPPSHNLESVEKLHPKPGGDALNSGPIR